jgi:hypothetical protein
MSNQELEEKKKWVKVEEKGFQYVWKHCVVRVARAKAWEMVQVMYEESGLRYTLGEGE